MRIVRLDGSPPAVERLGAALADALDGGPAVLPLADDAPAPQIAAVADPGTGVLVATSGSTGPPRVVVLPPASVLACATAGTARLGGPSRWLLALPADHVAGVQVIVRALLAGAAPVVQDLRGGFRPDGFTAAAARTGPGRRRCTSIVPTQLLRLLDAGGAAVDALRGFDAVLVGGAALDPELRARAEAAGVPVVPTYGMTETAGGCVYDGVPLDGVRARLEPGSGRILLRGPTVATGYLGRPAETAAAFVGEEFRTDDVGRWVDGRLEVLGRLDDVIVTGGEKVGAAAIERVLTGQPGVRAACAVGLPDREWGAVVGAAVVAEPGADLEPERLRAAVRAALGRTAVPRVLRAVDALPLRGIGKPDRAAVARLLAATPATPPVG